MTKLERITACIADLTRWRSVRDNISRRNTFKAGSAGRVLENESLNEAIRLLTDYERVAKGVAAMSSSLSAKPTCAELLDNAQASIDATVADLKEARPACCTGNAALLLLDLIDRAVTMAARIRAIIESVKEKEESHGDS